MQQIDKDKDRQRFYAQGKDPGGSELNQLIDEAVVRTVKIKIPEQNKRDQRGKDPGRDVCDSSRKKQLVSQNNGKYIVAYHRYKTQETVDPESSLPFIQRF